MEYTAFNLAAWNPLNSIGMLLAMLHKRHCIQSGCTGPRCMDSTAYNRDPLHHNAWNPLHSLTLHGNHCIQTGCFGPCCIKSTAFNMVPFFTVHGIHCIQSRCMESTAFNRYDLGHAACNPLHSIGMLWAMQHEIHCFQSRCM